MSRSVCSVCEREPLVKECEIPAKLAKRCERPRAKLCETVAKPVKLAAKLAKVPAQPARN